MKQPFILISGIIAAIIAVVVFFVIPLYEDINLMKAHIGEKKDVVFKLKKLVEKIERWQIVLAEEKDNIDRIDLSLPQNKDLSNLIVSLENLGSASGISLQSVDVKSASKRRSLRSGDGAQKGFNSIDLVLELNGSYPAFKVFLSKLESNIRIFDVKSISFGAIEDESNISGEFNFSISGTAYYK